MPQQKETPAIPTVHAALDVLTIEQLQPLVALLPTPARPTRKGELVALIAQHLAGTQLHALWEQLDATQQLAVAETPRRARGLQRPPLQGQVWHFASLRHEEGFVGVRRNAVVTDIVVKSPGLSSPGLME